jgi:hypothetical protein
VIVRTQRFLATSQPPLYTWLQWPVFALVGRGVLGLALLKNALLFSIYLFVWLIARQVSGNERTASTAALATFLLPQISWEAQRDLTHSVLLTVASLAAFWTLLRMARDHRRGDVVLFGVCVAAGFLSKYNFVFFLAGLLAAAVSVPEIRRGLRARDLLLGLGLAALLASPHFLWAAQHLKETTLQAGRLRIAHGPFVLASSVLGIGALIEASIGFLGPLAVVSAIFAVGGAAASPGLAPAALEAPMPHLPAAAIVIESHDDDRRRMADAGPGARAIPAAIAPRTAGAGRAERLRGRFASAPPPSCSPWPAGLRPRVAEPRSAPYGPIARQIREAGFTRHPGLPTSDREPQTGVSRLALHLRRPRGLPDAHRRAVGLRLGPDLGEGDRGRRSRAQCPDLRRRAARLQPDRGLSPASGGALPVHGRRSARARFRRRPASGPPGSLVPR